MRNEVEILHQQQSPFRKGKAHGGSKRNDEADDNDEGEEEVDPSKLRVLEVKKT
jgi:hypothetical protein